MKSFEYGDDEIGTVQVAFGVSNMVIGFGVLTLPRVLAGMTESSDGWISIVIGGAVALGFGWIVAALAARFPKMGFRDMSAAVTNKAVANVTTLMIAMYTMLFVAYETRGLASISKLYLFDRTPDEAICLFFLLVLIYGVSGPSTALLRLNLLFLPAVLLVFFFVLVMNVSFFNVQNLKPLFISDWKKVLLASKETVVSFLGFEIFLFYNTWINQPKKMTRAMLYGVAGPFAIYLIVFIAVLGIFGSAVVQNTLYPTAELAKQVEVPGGFFERFESIFFTTWVMTLFSTAALALDVTIIALRSVFPGPDRMTWIFWLSPVIYLITMQPQNAAEIDAFGKWIGYTGLALGWCIPAIVLAVAAIRGIKGGEKNA